MTIHDDRETTETANVEKDQSNKLEMTTMLLTKKMPKASFFLTVSYCMIRLVKNYLQNLGKPKCHILPRIDLKLCTTVSKAE